MSWVEFFRKGRVHLSSGSLNVCLRLEAIGDAPCGGRYFPSRVMNANAPAVRPTIIATSKIFLTPVLNTLGGMMSKTNSVASPATSRIAMDAVNLIIPVIESPFYSMSAAGHKQSSRLYHSNDRFRMLSGHSTWLNVCSYQ